MKAVQAMLVAILALLSVCVGATEATALSEPAHPAASAPFSSPPSAREMWVNFGGFSRHFARNKGYNESNLGLGVEYRLNPDVSVMAGSYYNSIRRTTSYATVNWQPYRLGDVKVGASVGLMDGYPALSRGGSFFVAVPMLTYEGRRWGLNLGVIPSAGNVNSALFMQLKVRAF